MLRVLQGLALLGLLSGAFALAGLEPLPVLTCAASGVLGAAWWRRAPELMSNEVRAVCLDPDFGRLGLFGDQVWRGSVELPGLTRPLDLEIETEGVRPTIAHRLALRDARHRWRGLEREICGRLRDESGDGTPCYLTLRLPIEREFESQDWSVGGLIAGPDGGRGFRVRVHGGEVVDVDLAA